MANGLLELIPVGGREMGGLVELDRAQGVLAEHAVDDTDVEVEVSVELSKDDDAEPGDNLQRPEKDVVHLNFRIGAIPRISKCPRRGR